MNHVDRQTHRDTNFPLCVHFMHFIQRTHNLYHNVLVTQLIEKFLAFMESKGSLPYTQKPVTRSLTESVVHTPILHFYKIQSAPWSPKWSLTLQLSN
jgi:hypothetical protein